MKRLIVPFIIGLALLIALAAFVSARFLWASERSPFVLVIAPAGAASEVRMTSAETVSKVDGGNGDFVMADFFAVDAASRRALVGRDALTITLHQDGKPLGSFAFTAVGVASDDLFQVRSLVEFLVDRRPAVDVSGPIGHLRRSLAGHGEVSVWRKSGASSGKGEFLVVATERSELAGWQAAYLSFSH